MGKKTRKHCKKNKRNCNKDAKKGTLLKCRLKTCRAKNIKQCMEQLVVEVLEKIYNFFISVFCIFFKLFINIFI